MKYLISIVVLLFVIPSTHLSAQSSRTLTEFGLYTNSFLLQSRDTLYQLPREFIAEGSEHILIDSTIRLLPIRDYRMQYREGRIIFSSFQLKRILSDTNSHFMSISYRTIPINLKHEYSLRQLEIRRDSSGGNKTLFLQPSRGILTDDLFGSGLQKSGSIVRGFSVGSNQDLSLTSGFRMQLAGKLAQDIDISAALTD